MSFRITNERNWQWTASTSLVYMSQTGGHTDVFRVIFKLLVILSILSRVVCGFQTHRQLIRRRQRCLEYLTSLVDVFTSGLPVLTAVVGVGGCIHDNGGCDQICIPVPHVGRRRVECRCRPGYRLDIDGRSCTGLYSHSIPAALNSADTPTLQSWNRLTPAAQNSRLRDSVVPGRVWSSQGLICQIRTTLAARVSSITIRCALFCQKYGDIFSK